MGPAYAADVRLGLLALGDVSAQGNLLADAGFDAVSPATVGSPEGA